MTGYTEVTQSFTEEKKRATELFLNDVTQRDTEENGEPQSFATDFVF
jgi:hypothetical protein